MLSFKMKGDVTSDHFLMLCFQKESLDTIGFWAYTGVKSPEPKGDIRPTAILKPTGAAIAIVRALNEFHWETVWRQNI